MVGWLSWGGLLVIFRRQTAKRMPFVHTESIRNNAGLLVARMEIRGGPSTAESEARTAMSPSSIVEWLPLVSSLGQARNSKNRQGWIRRWICIWTNWAVPRWPVACHNRTVIMDDAYVHTVRTYVHNKNILEPGSDLADLVWARPPPLSSLGK